MKYSNVIFEYNLLSVSGGFNVSGYEKQRGKIGTPLNLSVTFISEDQAHAYMNRIADKLSNLWRVEL